MSGGSPTSSSPGMQGWRLGWGARGDASTLRSGPIQSWRRVYHPYVWGGGGGGRREEGEGRREAAAESSGRTSCGEGTHSCAGVLGDRTPLHSSTPLPSSSQCMGRGETGGVPISHKEDTSPPHIPARNRAFKVHHFQSSSQQPSKLEIVLISILQMRKLMLSWPSSLPQDAHCHQSHLLDLGTVIPPPRAQAHRDGLMGGVRTDVLGGTVGLRCFSPGQCQTG